MNKGKFFKNSRMRRSAAFLLSLLMVVTSFNTAGIPSYAGEIENADSIVEEIYDVSDNLSTDEDGGVESIPDDSEEADNSETESSFDEAAAAEESEEGFETEEYDAVPEETVLDVGTLWADGKNHSIIVTDNGYYVCTAATSSSEWEYGGYSTGVYLIPAGAVFTPFKRLVITGTVSNSGSSVVLAGCAYGSTIILEDLVVLTSTTTILQVYADTKVVTSGTIRLGARIATSPGSTGGPNNSEIYLSSGKLTLTGDGDIIMSSGQISGSSMIGGSSGTLETENYTGDLFLDASNCSGTSLINITTNFETTGTIDIRGGSGATALSASSVSLTASDVKLSSAGCKISDAGTLAVHSTGNISADYNLASGSYSTPLFSGGSLVLEAEGDINITSNSSGSVFSCGTDDITAGGNINLKLTNKNISVAFNCGTNRIKAGKAFVVDVPQDMYNSSSPFFSDGSDVIEAHDDFSYVSNKFFAGGGGTTIKTSGNVEINTFRSALYSGNYLKVYADGDISMNSNSPSSTFACSSTDFKAGKNIYITSSPSGTPVFASSSNALDCPGVISIKRKTASSTNALFTGSAKVTGASSFVIEDDSPNKSAPEFCSSVLIDIPGSVYFDFGDAYGFNQVNIKNASDVTIKAKSTHGQLLSYIKEINASGKVSIISGDSIGSFDSYGGIIKAKTVELKGVSKNRPTIMGTSASIDADKIVFENTVSGNDLDLEIIDVTAKELSVTSIVAGVAEKFGFSGNEKKTAKLIHPGYLKKSANAKKDTVESIEDVDVKLLYEKKLVDTSLYTYEVGKGKTSTENDTVFITGKPMETYSPMYIIGRTSTEIRKGEEVAQVIIGETEIGFVSLDAALEFAASASSSENPVTIKLLKNCSSNGYYYNGDQCLIFDLNGHDVSANGGPLFNIYKGAELTIKDSGEGQSGKIIACDDYAITNDSAKLYIEGGTIRSEVKEYAVESSNKYDKPGFVGVSGGTIYGFKVGSNVNAEISGGRFVAPDNMSSALNLFGATPKYVTITGGVFEPAKDASGNDDGISVYAYGGMGEPIGDFFNDSAYGLKSVKDDKWIDVSEMFSLYESSYVAGGRVDIEQYDEEIGDFEDKYYLSGSVKPSPAEIPDISANITYTYGYVYTSDENEYGDSVNYLRIYGSGEYTGHIDREFYIVDESVTVPSEIKVSNDVQTTDDVELPLGWSFKEKVELSTDVSGNDAVAIFHTEVKGDTTGKFAPKDVKIFRSGCAHIPEFVVVEDATCAEDGHGKYVCSICHEILEDNISIPATGHDLTVKFCWEDFYTTSYGGGYVPYYIDCNKCGLHEYSTAYCNETKAGDSIIYTAKVSYYGEVFSESLTVANNGIRIALANTYPYEYTGAAITPKVSVFYKGTRLYEGSDYTVSYKDNVKASIDAEGKPLLQGYDKKKKKFYQLTPTVTIEGIGYYTGKTTKTFDIITRDIVDTVFSETGLVNDASGEYYVIAAPKKGKSANPISRITIDGITVPSSDYEIQCIKANETYNGSATVSLKDIKEGDYIAYVVGKNNLYGMKSIAFSVVKDPLFIENAKVTLDKNSHKVTKIAIGKKSFTGDQLTKVFDIEYPTDATEIGVHQIIIKPAPSSMTKIYGSEISVEYTVLGTALNKKWFEIKGTFTYNGADHEPAVSLTKKAPQTLTKDVDYKIEYSNNHNAGKNAVATITGIGKYRGTVNVKFTIKAATLSETTCQFTIGEITEYWKGGATPSLTIRDKTSGATLYEGFDYSIKCSKNNKPGTASVKITGKGNYTGSVTKQYKIGNKSIAAAGIEVAAEDMLFKKDGDYKAKVTVTDYGKKLKLGTDYKVTYDAARVVGEDIYEKGYVYLTATITGLGAYATKSLDPISGTEVPDSQTVSYRVCTEKASNLKIEFEKDSYVFNSGNDIMPNVTVYYGVKVGLKTIYIKLPKSFYRLEYSTNIVPGTGKVTVIGLKKYLGSKDATFKIDKRDITMNY